MYGKLLEAEMSLAKWKSTDHWKTRLQHGILQARDAKHSIPCQSWVMVSNIFLYVYSSLEKIPILINILIDGLKPPSSKVSEYSYFAQGCPITASESFFWGRSCMNSSAKSGSLGLFEPLHHPIKLNTQGTWNQNLVERKGSGSIVEFTHRTLFIWDICCI